MKIELILPGWKQTSLWNVKAFRFAPLSLATVAALVPPEHEVSITDENATPIDFNKEVDLVGISIMTPLANRAYEIADIFRKRGIKVVLGGIHASLLPEEAIQHADAVVIGEAEGGWSQLFKDLLNDKKMQKFYRCENKPSLENLPIPRRDLFEKKAYFTLNCVQTTRGCPFDCEFCSVSKFYGKTHRFRPIKEVEKELQTLKGNFVFFVDDNIIGNRAYARELFTMLKNYHFKWISQATVTILEDEELLKLCAKSGCITLLFGFESINQNSLKEAGKSFNQVTKYRALVEKCHDAGLLVDGVFIFGFDGDDKNVFNKTAEFIINNNIDAAQFALLTPLPGTSLFQRLEKEGRIITKDWSKYDHSNVVFQPKQMAPDELLDGLRWVYKEVYSYGSIFKRLTGFRKNFILNLAFNLGLRNIGQNLSKI